MRSHTHLLTGLAAASCMPGVVEQSVSGRVGPMLMAAAASLLPDFLDRHIASGLCRSDVAITPSPNAPRASELVKGLASAINASPDRTVTVRLNSCQVDSLSWLNYGVQFQRDPARLRIRFIGTFCAHGSRLDKGTPPRSASAPLELPVRTDGPQEIIAGASPDVTLAIEPASWGARHARLLPWRRAWSHALPLWFAIVTIIAFIDPLCGACAAAGSLTHLMLDQAGLIGICIFSPFNSQRLPGWRWWRSCSPLANAVATVAACLLLIWRLHPHTSA